MEHLSHSDFKPATVPTLMMDLGIEASERNEFGMTVANLAKVGKLLTNEEGLIALPPIGDEVIGTFRKNPRGFGFVVLEDKVREGDVFIPPDGVSNALTGDRVKVRITHQRRNGADDIVGDIIEVLSRKRKSFTGELLKQGVTWLVHPDGKELTRPIVVRDAEAKNAKSGDKVVVEITHYPEGDVLPEGVITRVLGEAGGVPVADRERTWNQGIGMIAVVGRDEADDVVATLSGAGTRAWVCGEVADVDPSATVDDETSRGTKGVDGGSARLVGLHR